MTRDKGNSKRKVRIIVSRALIIVGALAIAISVGYEMAGYPWGLIFNPDKQQIDDLPAPPKLEIPVKSLAELELTDSKPENPSLPRVDSIIGAASDESDRDAGAEPENYLIGVFKIPKLDVSENLLEGGDEQMMYGVGHIGGTTMPGGEGNCSISGHRNYIVKHPFRHLDKLSPGDKVFMYVDGNEFVYTVFDSFEVEPSEVWVLNDIEGTARALTLVTCTPVVNATRRLIVRCELTEVNNQPPAPSALEYAIKMRV